MEVPLWAWLVSTLLRTTLSVLSAVCYHWCGGRTAPASRPSTPACQFPGFLGALPPPAPPPLWEELEEEEVEEEEVPPTPPQEWRGRWRCRHLPGSHFPH